MLFSFIGLVATLTLWSTIASVPFTAITPRESFGRRLTGAIKVSLITTGALEVAKAATPTVCYPSAEPVKLAERPEPLNRLPQTYEEFMALPPINFDDYGDEDERPATLNGRPFPWHLLKAIGTPCSWEVAAAPFPGATHTSRVDIDSPCNFSEFLSVCGYLGLILASLALGRCLGAYYFARPANEMDAGELDLLPAEASPALPPSVVSDLQRELRTELVNGLPLMQDSQPYISSTLVHQIAEAANLHSTTPQPVYTTEQQTGTQSQALVLRRLENISPFVLIQILRLLVSALESGNFGSQEPKPEPKLDLAAPQGEPKKKRNRPGQKQRRRMWARSMIALQEKVIQEAEGKSQS
ncbi:uncharacterized protein GIQ15_01252 [Arthroderma uncinatum]|uniref:uncharacterized protein n=1 Tax=Arthroderma uncinatum TaxID=74035 RepID=UPI00144AF9CA|nr:uncharacterized protein GIQ15_01252 [Arthroderma uncinatum]KAF3491735.1 hypothetical protein GIQ15_01252 [Arthroderma uncinatum]